MIDRRSSALVRAMTSLLIVVFAGAARAEDLRREVDALRQDDRHRPGSGDARQPRAPGPRGPGRDPPVPHGPRRRPHARAAAAGAGTVARRRTAALASRPAAARRRHPSARRVSDREGGLRLPPGLAGPGPSVRPRGTRPPRAGRPVLPRPLVARQQGPARTSRPSASTWPGSASSCSASTRSARGSGASRRATTAAPRRCWSGSPSRGSPSTRPAARWSTCSRAPRSIRSGSG